MSAEEYLYDTYGGVSGDDMSDFSHGEFDVCPAHAERPSRITKKYPSVFKPTTSYIEFRKNLTKELYPSSTPKEENAMPNSIISRKIVEVRFENGGNLSEKCYAYFTDIEDLEPGDWVVVVVGDTPKTAMVTRVRGLSKSSQSSVSKWIAFKVDLFDYELKVKKDEVIRQIEEELDAEMQRVNRMEVLRSCAKNSPVMQSLIKKLEELAPDVKLLQD